MLRYWHAVLLTCALAVLPALCGCGAPPQLGGNKEALAAADALWTAVTAKRTDLVETSAGRLAQLKQAGEISADASAALEAIVAQARAGKWDSARDDLKSFVKGQRGSK